MKIVLLLALLGISPSVHGDDFGVTDHNQVSMIQSYKAYAAYKMGHYDQAYELWLPLAQKGHTSSMINIANLYVQQQGDVVSQQEAKEWLLQAKTLGDTRADEMLAGF